MVNGPWKDGECANNIHKAHAPQVPRLSVHVLLVH